MDEGEENLRSDISTDEAHFLSVAHTPVHLRHSDQIQVCSNDIRSLPIQEASPQDNSLEVETGRGSCQVFYPPSIYTSTSRPVPVFGQIQPVYPTDTSAVYQTSRTRNPSDSSDSHSPREANTPCGSPGNIHNDELVTSAKFSDKPTDIQRPERYSNNGDISHIISVPRAYPCMQPIQLVRKRTHVRGETALFDNVLDVPNCPGYENIDSAFIDQESPRTSSSRRLHRHNLYPPQRLKYPEYKDETKRLRSFRKWPDKLPSPRSLAAANLFYRGLVHHADGTVDDDMVYCYKCGRTLCKFNPTDDPEEEHNKWFPECFQTNWEN